MTPIILEVTLTGATGESAAVPVPFGHIISGYIDYVGQSGNTADVTLINTVDSVERTVATISNQNTDRVLTPIAQAHGTDGADVSGQYAAGWAIFGGTLHIEVAGAAAGSIRLTLNVIE